MTTLYVDGVTFLFPPGWTVSKYDDWSFYRNRFIKIPAGLKALDLLAIAPDRTAWLIEVKDYRMHRRSKVISLPGEVMRKALDTLSAMLPAKINGDVADETMVSSQVIAARRLRVVLHLEQPAHHSKLFPRAIDPADVQLKLRQLVKAIDAHPWVVEINSPGGIPWAVQ